MQDKPIAVDPTKCDPAKWVDSYGDALFAFAIVRLRDRNLAEEAVQETLLSALKSIDQYRQTGTEGAWLMGILKRKVIDQVRSQAKQPASVGNDPVVSALFDKRGNWSKSAKANAAMQLDSTLAYVKPGEVFGELALFDPSERGEYVESVEASVLIRIPKQRIQELMNRELDVALAVTKLVGLRRQRIERRLRTLFFTSNQHRLNHLLLDLAEQFGVAIDGGIRLGLKLSHQEIANLIGTTRETVTILMGKLKSDGLVSGQRQTVILNDMSRLAESVGRSA